MVRAGTVGRMTTEGVNKTLWPVQLLLVLLLTQGPVWTVEALDASLFTNIACGANSNLTLNGLTYVPDNLEAGNASSIPEPVPGVSHFLRYFQPVPGTRNLHCYSLNLPTGKTLVRATFYYGNYDIKQQPPAFRVLLDTTSIATVNLSMNNLLVEEVIVDGSATPVPFCLLAIPGGGAPVISLLEVRPLPLGSYQTRNSVNLRGLYRINCGATQAPLRYPNDTFDRIWGIDQGWKPDLPNATVAINVKESINLTQVGSPSPVMQSDRKLVSLGDLTYPLRLSSEVRTYQVTGYFANLENGTSPAFNVTANGKVQRGLSTVAPLFVASQHTFTVAASDWLNYSLVGITGFPFLNALEVFEVINLGPQTNPNDVDALHRLRSSYDVIGDWDTWDPCLPSSWQQVVCSSDVEPRVTEMLLSGFLPTSTNIYTLGDLAALKILELQNNSLTSSQIQFTSLRNLQLLNLSHNLLTSVPTFDKDVALETLDLQHNLIAGPIPDSLSKLTHLQWLDLSNNRFTGAIPQWIISSNVVVNLSGNCFGDEGCVGDPASNPVMPSSRSRKSNGVVVGASAAGGILLLLILFSGMILLCWRKRKPRNKDAGSTQTSDIRNWTAATRFSLEQLTAATKNFKNVLGEGGFGPVYLGTLPGGREVAVKLRADKSRIGVSAFGNEVDLLSRVHHRNLVSLLGFCDEAGKQCLVYEYIPNGTLADHLYGSHARTMPMDFKTRLMVAIGAATGIEYLHTSCNPMIIHRDIKTTNILLDNNLEAKVCDFGFSKVVENSAATHVTTAVKGTAGYLDPEYYITQQLTEKSDVYSFGVVLLEMLCAREPLSSTVTPDEYSLIAWALPYLRRKSYSTVLDPTLEGLANPLSLDIVATLVVRSLEKLPANRPRISAVLNDLKAALSLEAKGKESGDHVHPATRDLFFFSGGPEAR